jgi:hypothetical protein
MGESLILVGIGKFDLKDMLEKAASSLEGQRTLLEAFDRFHWPPRYRRVSACTDEEITTFSTYVNWVMENIQNE